ncbi:MAG: 16S rRNA (guanine(966)-N(2))-methyltransferase RsmD [Lachnospira sp.]|nr:16S rRNA (guanine(966)-N(2))-methyltransferase RsmD [Lachnospira sp.]
MRVIAGTARSMPLKTIEGLDTRPTTDRIKETLFNMLQTEIYGCRFLDLFAGSGGIGIEALSRGAKDAVFVENSKTAVACIKDNLKFTHLDDNAVVMEQDVLTAINRLSGKGVFDIVFIDAPYGMGYDKSTLTALANSNIIDEYTTVIVEEKLDADVSYVSELGFKLNKIKNYKTNKHIFVSLEKIGD